MNSYTLKHYQKLIANIPGDQGSRNTTISSYRAKGVVNK